MSIFSRKADSRLTGELSADPAVREEVQRLLAEMKAGLLSSVSHEFRTPLTLIISPMEQMLSQSTEPEQRKTLSLMFRNAQRLLFLTNQLLELSKVQNRELELKATSQDAVAFLRGIIASFRQLAEQKEIRLELESECPVITLHFEAEKLAEVMCNLIMNALKYTPPGGRIIVSLRAVGNDVEISIKDTGSGISREKLPHLFERIFQLNDSYELHRKGFGIGLVLVKEYVNLHGGRIEVNSEFGVGTEFIIHLPRGNEHLGQGEIAERTTGKALETGSHISNHYAYILELEREEDLRTGESTGKTGDVGDTLKSMADAENQVKDIVLVVEDSADMRKFVTQILSHFFFVEEAPDGKAGIEKARAIIPDIIVSDIIMPEVDGYSLCSELKNDVHTSHIPIILLSAKTGENDIIRGLEVGADDYVTKPFNIKMLIARVKNLINQRKKLQTRIQEQMKIEPEELILSQLDNSLLSRIQEVIEAHLSEVDFGLEKLAGVLSMSSAVLYRKVQALTGHSPNQYIRAYRLKRSIEFLKSNHGNVLEVAARVGFSNAESFTRNFKERFNQTPSDYLRFCPRSTGQQ
jgi:DNA-binding response OmpR family regulator/two-component sensor histidine kinase